MKRAHQKIHRVLWPILLPVMIVVVIAALSGRVDPMPTNTLGIEKVGGLLP